MYSVLPILHHHTDRHNHRKIIFQVIYNRTKVYQPTPFKILETQFDGSVIGHPLAKKMNQQLNSKRIELESKLISLEGVGRKLNADELKEYLTGIHKDTGLFSDFVEQLNEDLKGKLSTGRLKRYTVIKNKITDFRPDTHLYEIDITFMDRFEKYLRSKKLDGNTINTLIKALKSILSKAGERKLFDPKQIAGYKVPAYTQKIPDYLTEDEMAAFEKVVAASNHSYKLAGYYFLLGCFAGYRIGDLKAFDYSKRIKGDKILLRAKKNGNIVSILIYPMLQRVLDFVKDHPLKLSEQHTREYVKEIATIAGIGRKIKLHTARHSFAMMLINKGFTVDEVAELLGDSKDVAKVYARITNTVIDNKVRALLH
jgi:site-specific recombinase XerD